MKILYVIHEFFPQFYTGTARFGLNLAKQMQKMGHQVRVLTYGLTEEYGLSSMGNLLYKKYEYDSISVISFKHKNFNPKINFDIFCSDIEGEIKALIDAENLGDIDIVHILHPLRTGIILKIFKDKNTRIIMTLTDYWTLCPRVQLLKRDNSICNGPSEGEKCSIMCGYTNQETISRFKDVKSLFDLADVIAVPSNLVKHIFNLNRFYDEKIRIIKHGLDYKFFYKINGKIYSKNDTICFGYVGPVLRHKGIHLLIDSFSKVESDNIKLKIYGSYGLYQGDYFEELKLLASSDNRISLMGEYDYNLLSNILETIDIVVLPTIWYETYSIALTEVLAHDIPIIASNTLGAALEYIKEGVNGFFFDLGDGKKLAKIIERVGNNPTLLNELKKNIVYPPRIEEEALQYELVYKKVGSNE